MNRRGFLGSLVALVAVPKLVPVTITSPAAPMAPSEVLGYSWAQPVQLKTGDIVTISGSWGRPQTYVLGDVVTAEKR